VVSDGDNRWISFFAYYGTFVINTTNHSTKNCKRALKPFRRKKKMGEIINNTNTINRL